MNHRSTQVLRQSSVRRAAATAVERLENRAYLSSPVLGEQTNLSASAAGISPQFDWLAPLNNSVNTDDLIVSNSSNSISVLLGNGNGSFQSPATTYPVSGQPLPLLAAPMVTGNSTLDIVVGTTGSPGDVNILLGNGDGTFQAAIPIPALGSNHAIAVGAFVDGEPMDIVTASNNATASNNLEVIFTDGAGHEASEVPLNIAHGGISAVQVGNFGNGHEDIAVLSQTDSTVTIFLGNGDGTFQAPVDYKTGASPTSLAVGDFNGDGKQDIVTADSTAGTVSFLAGIGNGTFAPKVDSAVAGSAAGGGPLKVRVDNFSNSGNADLLCLLSPGSSGDATVLLGQGNGTFVSVAPISTHGGTRTGIAAGDLNGDGLTDIVISNSSEVSSLLNITGQDTTTPTASVDASQADGSDQSTTYDFTVTYTDSAQVDVQTLGNGNLTVTAPSTLFPGNATTENATLVSTGLVSGATVHAKYSVTFPADMTTGDNGVYQVSMNSSNAVMNAGGVAVPAGSIGSFTLNVTNVAPPDTTPPTAIVNASQPAASTSSKTYDFNVTYSDNVAVMASTLGNGNLTVAFPGGASQAATLVSQNLVNGAAVQATYQISFASDITTANNGTYTVNMNANSVTDTSSNPVAVGEIGTFTLNVSSQVVAPSGDFAISAPTGKILGSVVSGSKQKGSLKVTVTYNGTSIVTGTVTVSLYTSSTQIHDSSAVLIEQVTKKFKKAKPGKTFKASFKPFLYPSTAGSYYLVSDAALNGTLDSFDGAIPSPITVAQAFVDISALSAAPSKATLAAGKKLTAALTIENLGNVTYKGPATVDVSMVPVGGGTSTVIATAVPVKLNIQSGKTKKVRVNFLPATLPASGSYNLVLTINVPGDTNTANNTVTSIATLTI